MKKRFRNLTFVLALMMAPWASQAQTFFSNSGSPLAQAHKAYLSGNFKVMAAHLRQALENHPYDSLVKENAISLLKKAYEVSANIPTDWRLPDEIKQMKISSKRSVREDSGYNFRVYGSTVHPRSIVQLQVIQYPDQVVLDKQAGIGTWNDDSGIDHLSHDYELQSKKSRQPVPSGLYLMNLTLSDGTQTKGWFILDEDINSTATPRVFMPSADQIFKTGNPTFTWSNFVSPQYKPFEKRSLWVGVSRNEPPNYNWDEVWGHYETPPTNEQITIDSQGDEDSVSKLGPGNYVFFIDYHERHKFGDLDLSRDSITVRNFRVTQ